MYYSDVGAASLKYGAEDLTSKVWQTSQTFEGRRFGPDKTVLLKQF